MTAPRRIAIAIIGAGPAGLSAAARLAAAGIGPVEVLEREPEPGGIPRHCAHSLYGFKEFRRILRGRAYAAALAARATRAGARIRVLTSVMALTQDGRLSLSSPDGAEDLQADLVLLAVGARETPASARLIGGEKQAGILTTGALQSMVHIHGIRPFRRPVVAGSELVAFSALLTCRDAGARPAAMLAEGGRIAARPPFALLPPILGVPLLRRTRLLAVHGRERVEAVSIEQDGRERRLAADGVVLTGRFRPENHLARMAGLAIDPLSLGPEIDQWGRSSAPRIFAAGNALRGVETAAWCWAEAGRTADAMIAALDGALPERADAAPLEREGPLAWALPQRIGAGEAPPAHPRLQLHLSAPVVGALEAGAAREGLDAMPHRRLSAPLPGPIAPRLSVRPRAEDAA